MGFDQFQLGTVFNSQTAIPYRNNTATNLADMHWYALSENSVMHKGTFLSFYIIFFKDFAKFGIQPVVGIFLIWYIFNMSTLCFIVWVGRKIKNS